jgi:hypothetical protein
VIFLIFCLSLFCILCPLKVWVLDATPGKVRAGGDGEDHPAELIESLRRMPMQVGLLALYVHLYDCKIESAEVDAICFTICFLFSEL